MKLPLLARFDRNAHRLREIVTVLAKYGIADWLAGLHYDFLKNWLRSADGQKLGGLTTEPKLRSNTRTSHWACMARQSAKVRATFW
jgi:hypothetical protein